MVHPGKHPEQNADGSRHDEAVWLDLIRRQVASLRYGVVQIVVHEGRVTQIERTERVRLEKPQTE